MVIEPPSKPDPERNPPVYWIDLGPTGHLLSSSRHHLTLRHSTTGDYHSLVIFSFPSVGSSPKVPSYYCMEATCPHLGAPLENATLEEKEAEEGDDIEDFVEYDFSLRTGESSTGINACVYSCVVRDDHLLVEAPKIQGQLASEWDIVELRPVSEAYANLTGREDVARNLHKAVSKVDIGQDDAEKGKPSVGIQLDGRSEEADKEVELGGGKRQEASYQNIPVPSPQPKTLVEWAVLVLNTPSPAVKVAYTRYAAKAFRSGECKIIGGGRWSSTSGKEEEDGESGGERRWLRKENETPPDVPGREKNEVRVKPGTEGKRGRGGSEKSRIAILHSLANIEQWAIDLAWDIIARAPELCARFFETAAGEEQKGTRRTREKMPTQFFSDFVKVAEDEAKHFTLLEMRLTEMGSYFGALPVHHGLWESAKDTRHSLTARLSIIHLVHEARGLDVNPTTIKKFENAGDLQSSEILTTIHLDEITHVSAGHRWLTYLCNEAKPEKLDPIKVFREEVRKNFLGKLKGPFNGKDRSKAGLDREWYADLSGEKRNLVDPAAGGRDEVVGVQRSEVAGG
ncbi:DUF455-domain-containing protein [Violaceomyces palustris]|uniref:DUF455-domain-containing protein n=1 Tax=Violaceomyces palustris TaxID=1673888 RepID=A0ACD0P584_9BASI|nr:DUF455-domain-containing protein [Violaceomyces palustris]